MINKEEYINRIINKLKNVSKLEMKNNRYDRSLAAISASADILYKYNQVYMDEDLELLAMEIGSKLANKYKLKSFSVNHVSNTVLFYDGFALDSRGVVLMYLNALGKNGYSVIYITDKSKENKLPSIQAMCNKYCFKMMFIEMSNYEKSFLQLASIFNTVKPKTAFYYTTPYDSAAAAAFSVYNGLCDRYLIDLTDHAFWLGKNSNDYFLGSREMSAYIEHFEREIPKQNCIKLGVNLLVEDIPNHEGLPFDVTRTRYIFSGGALYKTLGDSNNTYYKIIEHFLRNHEDLHFIYAGSGDDRELKKIIELFPSRAFHINERKDFYYILQNCVIYLNTFPMFGGMMMKYAALAKKLPITLRHDNDSDGLLLNQDKCKIEYDSYEELINDVDLLLNDEKYLKERELLLEGSIITESRFVNNLKNAIENKKTDYEHEFKFIDTEKFRREYYERFDENDIIESITKKKNIGLFKYFSIFFIKKIFFKRGLMSND